MHSKFFEYVEEHDKIYFLKCFLFKIIFLIFLKFVCDTMVLK